MFVIITEEFMPKHHPSTTHKNKDKSKFFQETKQECKGVTQTTTVTVNIDQKEDCLTSFINALCGCGKSAK